MNYKKLLAILTAVAMMFAFVSCGKQAEPAPEPEPEAEEYELSGDIITANEKEMTIQLESGEQVTFSLADAVVESYNGKENVDNGEDEGDWATISYTGDMDNFDASGCTATHVYVEEGELQEISGTLIDYSIAGTNLTISSGGKNLTFDLTYAERHYKDGLKIGDNLELSYYGVINGTDTKDAYVYTVIDNDLEKDKHDENVIVKVVDETVYTTGVVNVRAGSGEGTEKIATLAKGSKLKRTGILSDGWSRVVYEGKSRYIISSALTTKNPKQKHTKKTTEKTTEKPTEPPTQPPTEPPTQPPTEPPTEPSSEDPTDPTQPSSDEPVPEETKVVKGVVEKMDVSEKTTTLYVTVEGKSYTLDISDANVHIMSGSVEGAKATIEYWGNDLDDCNVVEVWIEE